MSEIVWMQPRPTHPTVLDRVRQIIEKRRVLYARAEAYWTSGEKSQAAVDRLNRLQDEVAVIEELAMTQDIPEQRAIAERRWDRERHERLVKERDIRFGQWCDGVPQDGDWWLLGNYRDPASDYVEFTVTR